MKVTTLEHDDHITRVVLHGRLDALGVDEISGRLAEALEAAKPSTIIDLSQIEFMGSRGLGLLLANGKRLTKAGRKLVLLNPTVMVETVLRTTKLDQVMPIAHGLEEALQVLGGAPSRVVSESPGIQTPGNEPGEQPAEVDSTAAVVSEGELKLEIENELTELGGLNATLAEFLGGHGVPHKAAYAMNLAIDELVGNVIRYAYVDDDTHLIDIQLAIEGEQIILRIADDGRPCDPRKGPALDLHAEDREVAGMGLLLVLEMVDVLKYRRVDEMNRVEVRVHFFAEEDNPSRPVSQENI